MRYVRFVVGVCLGLIVIVRGAAADPLAVRSGKVVLPMTGLVIDLPKDARKGAAWQLSGSWSLSNGGASFDGRDVIDLKVGDRLVSGNWIHAGYFDAGDCAAVVKEAEVTDRWEGEADLFGSHFTASGGTWDFENELGKAPVLVLCTSVAGGKTLLLYHFFLEPGAPVGKAGLRAIAKDKLLARVTRAWKAESVGDVRPTHRPEVRQRGDIAAARRVTLAHTDLPLDIPDDGFVWLSRAVGEDGGSDMLDRMAPSLPDITLEVARVRGQSCAAVLGELAANATTVAEPAPLGVPVLWTAYPTIVVDGGAYERVICRDVGGALIVGLLGTPYVSTAARDFGPFAMMLDALAAAAAR